MNIDVLKQMGDTGSEAVLIYHFPTQRFLYLNPMVSLILERPAEGFMQEPARIRAAIHPEDLPLLSDLFQRLLNGSLFLQTEARIILPRSEIKLVKIKTYAFRNEQNDLCLAAFAEDISSQRSHENYLVEFGNKKNSALEILAHDLSGPLQIARTLALTLEQEPENITKGQATDYTRIIQQVCESSLNLIGDILTEEHLKSPTIQLKKEPVNLVSLCRQIVAVYQSVKTNPQTIEVISNSMEMLAAVDKIKFSQIVNNLVSNAIKFTPTEGSIRLTITDTGPEVLLALSDTGIGIPDNLQPFIFFHYSIAARTGLNGEPTRGIGLYITKILVEMHLGKIWFENNAGSGATFYVLLPKS